MMGKGISVDHAGSTRERPMLSVTVKRKVYYDAKAGTLAGSVDGLEDSLNLLEGKAKDFAPVRRGILRGGIFQRLKRFSGAVISPVLYSLFQERGTRYMEAANRGRGYMKPAADFLKARVAGIFGKSIRSGIRRS